MKAEEFNKLTNELLDTCKELLGTKSVEYDFSKDRLHSFKSGSVILNTNPKKVLLGYLTKHIISIYDMINSDKKFPQTKWDEKIMDAINYFCLLNALIHEENEIGTDNE